MATTPDLLGGFDGDPVIEFAPMLVVLSRIHDLDAAARRLHRHRVAAYINGVLRTFSNKHNTVPENLANAQSFVVEERKPDGSNTLLRDAEYYLKARAMIAARRHKPTRVVCKWGGVILTLFYNGAKFVALDGVMRVDKENPNSPPGGEDWVIRGATDGYSDPFAVRGAARALMLRE